MWRDPRTGTILRDGAVQNWPSPREEEYISSLRAREAAIRDSERQSEREVKAMEAASAELEAAKSKKKPVAVAAAKPSVAPWPSSA